MTSKFSRINRNKCQVKKPKPDYCIQKHYTILQPLKLVVPIATSSSITLKHTQFYYISEQPSKLVVPVPDKVQGTHQVKVDTHSAIHSETEQKETPQESRKQLKNTKLQPTQPVIPVAEKHRSEHEIRQFPHNLEPIKKDN